MLNLACSSVLGSLCSRVVGMWRFVPTRMRGDVLRPDIVLLDQARKSGHAGMGQRAGRIGLDADPGGREGPGRPEPAADGAVVMAARRGVVEAPPSLEDGGGGGEAAGDEVGRQDSAFGGPAGVERFGHGAEILAHPAAWLPAMPSTMAASCRVEPSRLATPAAAPNMPQVPVVWKPSW